MFLATPHRPNTQLAWDEVLLDTTKETKITYYGQLSGFSTNLVDTVTHLSHVCSNFAAKYPIMNFIEGKGFGNYGPVWDSYSMFSRYALKTLTFIDRW